MHILVGHSLVFEHNLLHFKCFFYKIFFEKFPTNTLSLPSSTTQNLDLHPKMPRLIYQFLRKQI